MKYLLYCFLLQMLVSNIADSAFAQSSYSDSLITELNLVSDDSSRIELLIKISLSFTQTDPDTATHFALEANKIAEGIEDLSLKVKVSNHLGGIYIRKGMYGQALTSFQASLTTLNQLPDQKLLRARTLRGIGNIYFIQYRYDEAIQFYEEALEYFQEVNDSAGINQVYGGFANVYFETRETEKAIYYYKKQIDYYIATNDEMGLGSSYLNIGMLYDTIDSLTLAISYSEKALAIAEKNNALVMMTYPLKVLHSVSNSLENFEKGIEYGQKSLDLAQQLGIIYEEKDAHSNLSYSYERLGNYKAAYEHYKSFKELNDSLLNEDANARLAEMRAQYETEQKEQEILVLETENQLQQARIVAITTSLGLVATLAIVWLFWFSVRKRKEIQLLEKDKLLAETERKLASEELESSRLREENLQSELTNFALHIVEKNDFLEEVKVEMAAIRNEVSNQDALTQINKLGSKIYQNLMLNRDREEFEIQVDHACDGFYKKLEKRYPELTSQERRLAALLRLNLSSKEISGILNISPKSVDQGRYRLRKKMALKKKKSLAMYLNQM
ncbi:MAG: tetratricopeptide repeat protein [Balneola sp.]